MSKPRISDIAEAAGVSPATVTRVLRGKGYASQEKKELVLQTAEILGYDFSRRQTDNGLPQILIISPYSYPERNELFPIIQETICSEIEKLGWFCITYYVTSGNIDDITRLIEATKSLNLKGIIFNCLEFSDNLSAFRKLLTSLTTPVVMIERFPDIFGLNKIMINAKETLFLAVKHLYKRGHRKIVFFSPDSAHEVEHSRIEGFYNAAAAMGLSDEARFIPIQTYAQECGRKAFESYVASYGLPTAVICADPVMVGVSQYLYEHQIRIPDDISLISLDDSFADIMTPPLTSIAFPVAEIARNVIQLISEGKNEFSKTISLSTYLIDRNTVAPPKE